MGSHSTLGRRVRLSHPPFKLSFRMRLSRLEGDFSTILPSPAMGTTRWNLFENHPFTPHYHPPTGTNSHTTGSANVWYASPRTDSLDQTHGFEGLKDLPPIHKSHPQTTPPETVARHRLALEHPAYGCNRLEGLLSLEGQRVSAVTIQTRRVGP